MKTNIQWTDYTWNIAVGCTKVDADCKYCYMYREGERFKYDAQVVRKTKTVFRLPLRIKKPSRIFVSSLTDVFHPEIDAFREEMWDIIRQCPQHTFQILTKRPERIADHLPADWGKGWDHVWLGTSVGSQAAADRISQLLWIPACVHFLSLEPLHGPVQISWLLHRFRENVLRYDSLATPDQLDRHGLDWVIIGGESGNETGKYRYRPCRLEWIRSLMQECKEMDVPVFVKQLGTQLSKELGLKDRHGGAIKEWPEDLRVREFPTKCNAEQKR